MKCPVCRTECLEKLVCPTCGFGEVGKVFINQEEAEQWLNEIVVPYKEQYNKKNILPPLDWLEVFKEDPKVKRLMELSIPMTMRRKKNLESLNLIKDENYVSYLKDTILGHLAIISKNEMVRERFVDEFRKMYCREIQYKRTSSSAMEREGDVAAILTALEDGDVLFLEMNCKMRKGAATVLSKGISDFYLEIVIGKGPGARNIRLDIACFTALIVAESIKDIPKDVINNLEHIIELDFDDNKIIELQIREIASFYDIKLTMENIEAIKYYSNEKEFNGAKEVLKILSEHIFLNPELEQPLSGDVVHKIIGEFCK